MGRPSLGSWAMYGLGSASQDLPGYVVMRDGPLKGGPMTYGNGFLPAVYSATELSLSGVPIQYLDRPQSIGGDDQRRVLDFSQRLNRHSLALNQLLLLLLSVGIRENQRPQHQGNQRKYLEPRHIKSSD